MHPQGGPGYTLYAAYSGVVLIAGGSGISYIMGVLDDMLQKHASGKSRVCIIEVIWAIQDAGKRPSHKNFGPYPRKLTGVCKIRFALFTASRAHPAHAAAPIAIHLPLPPLQRTLDPSILSSTTHAAHGVAAGDVPPPRTPRHQWRAAKRDRGRAHRVLDEPEPEPEFTRAERHRHWFVRTDLAHRRGYRGCRPRKLDAME